MGDVVDTEPSVQWDFRETPCPACRSDSSRFVGWRGGDAHRAGRGEKARIVRCRKCSLLYPRPMPYPRDSSHYENPDEYFATHGSATSRIASFESIIRQAQRHGAGPPLLDIGCGRGESLAAARQLDWEAHGVEPSEAFARRGTEELDVQIEVGTVEGRYADNAFGLVLLAGVLEHVFEPLELLCEAKRVLRPGGILYVDIPNERSLLHRCARMAFLATGRNWTLSLSPTFSPYHVVGWSPPPLRSVFETVGLETVQIAGYPLKWIGGRVGYAVERATAPLRLSAGLVAWARKPLTPAALPADPAGS